MLWHGGRAFANAGIAMPAKIGENELKTTGEQFRGGAPEFAIRRKWMQQHQRRAFAQYFVNNIGIAAVDDHTSSYWLGTCAPEGTTTAWDCGASGITIQAIT